MPDVYVLGKALGGGIVPISAVVSTATCSGCSARRARLDVRRQPARVRGRARGGRLLGTGEFQARADAMGTALIERLRAEVPPSVKEVRGKGLWVGIELTPEAAPARDVCERLMDMGVLAKDTHETTVRLAPPLVVSQDDLDWATERILTALGERV